MGPLEVECYVCGATAVRREAHVAGWTFLARDLEVRNYCTKPECQNAGAAWGAQFPSGRGEPKRLADLSPEQLSRVLKPPRKDD
jgi:hypothetical protein